MTASAPAIPAVTAEERAAALEKARIARQLRAQLKRDLESGEKTFGDAFAMRDDEAIGRMKVVDLLQTLPQVGKITAEAIMEEAQIAPSRRLRGLGKRQTDELLAIEKKYRP